MINSVNGIFLENLEILYYWCQYSAVWYANIKYYFATFLFKWIFPIMTLKSKTQKFRIFLSTSLSPQQTRAK